MLDPAGSGKALSMLDLEALLYGAKGRQATEITLGKTFPVLLYVVVGFGRYIKEQEYFQYFHHQQQP